VGANAISLNFQRIISNFFYSIFVYFILKLKYINGKYQVIRSRKQDRFIKELIELLKIPSVSADTAYSQDVIDTSEAVKLSLEQAGCDFVEICETAGYPIVYGEK
jgi:hypothetical protein